VTEAQLRDIYNKNKKRFRRPESISFQTISVNIPEKPSAAQQTLARKRIEELLVAAKATRNYEEFGSLAEKSSEDDYRVMMGDHKWQHRVALEPALDQAIAALQPGQISGIISIPSQLTIVRLNDRRPEKQMEFSEIKADLRKDIEASTEKSRSEALKAQLRKGAKIEML
jgi:parvulin-like peptidyl-prolyl isomerase